MDLSRFFCSLAVIVCIVLQVQSLVIPSRDSAESDVYVNNEYQGVGERLKRKVDLLGAGMFGVTHDPSKYTLLEWLNLGHDEKSYTANTAIHVPELNAKGYIGTNGGGESRKLLGMGGKIHLGFLKPGHELHIGSTGGLEINKSGGLGAHKTGGYGIQGYGESSHGSGVDDSGNHHEWSKASESSNSHGLNSGSLSGGWNVHQSSSSEQQSITSSDKNHKFTGSGSSSYVSGSSAQFGGHGSTVLETNRYDKSQDHFSNDGGSRHESNGQSLNSYDHGSSFDSGAHSSGFQLHESNNVNRKISTESSSQVQSISTDSKSHQYGSTETAQYDESHNKIDISGGGRRHEMIGVDAGSYVHGSSVTHGAQSSGFQSHQTGSAHQFEMGNNINQGTGGLNINSHGLGGSIGLGVELGASQTHRPDNSQHRIEVGSSNQPQSIGTGINSNSYPSTGNTQYDKSQNKFQVSGGGGRHETIGMDAGSYVHGSSVTHGAQSSEYHSQETSSAHQFEAESHNNHEMAGSYMNSHGHDSSIGREVQSGTSQRFETDLSHHKISSGSSSQVQSISTDSKSHHYGSTETAQYDESHNKIDISGGGRRHELSGINTGSYVHGSSATHGAQSSGFESHQSGSAHQFEMENNINQGMAGLNMNSHGVDGSIGLGIESGASQTHRPDNSQHRIEVGSSNQPQSIGAGINSNSYLSTGNTQYDKSQNQFQVSGGGVRHELSGIDTSSYVHGSSGTHGAQSSGFQSHQTGSAHQFEMGNNINQGTGGLNMNSHGLGGSIGLGVESGASQTHRPDNSHHRIEVGSSNQPQSIDAGISSNSYPSTGNTQYDKSQNQFQASGGGGRHEMIGMDAGSYVHGSSVTHGAQSSEYHSQETSSAHQFEAESHNNHEMAGSYMNSHGHDSSIGQEVQSGTSQRFETDLSHHKISSESSSQVQSISTDSKSHHYGSTQTAQYDESHNKIDISGGGRRHEMIGMDAGSYVHGSSVTHGAQSNGYHNQETSGAHQFETESHNNHEMAGSYTNSHGPDFSIERESGVGEHIDHHHHHYHHHGYDDHDHDHHGHDVISESSGAYGTEESQYQLKLSDSRHHESSESSSNSHKHHSSSGYGTQSKGTQTNTSGGKWNSYGASKTDSHLLEFGGDALGLGVHTSVGHGNGILGLGIKTDILGVGDGLGIKIGI